MNEGQVDDIRFGSIAPNAPLFRVAVQSPYPHRVKLPARAERNVSSCFLASPRLRLTRQFSRKAGIAAHNRDLESINSKVQGPLIAGTYKVNQ